MRLVLILLLIVGFTVSTRNETKYIQKTLDVFFDSLKRGDSNTLNRVVKAPFATELAKRNTFIFFATHECRARSGVIKPEWPSVCSGLCEFPPDVAAKKFYRIAMKLDGVSPTGWRIFDFQPTADRG